MNVMGSNSVTGIVELSFFDKFIFLTGL